jgi:hypothetical protein
LCLALALAGAASCGDDADFRSADDDGSGDTDTDGDSDSDSDSDTDDECYEMIDIVFVIDVSTTMSYILSTLETEIGAVWDAAQSISYDDEPHFGLVVFVDDVMVVSSETYTDVATLQSDFNYWYTHTSSNQQTQSTASNGDWPENTIDGLYAAADQYNWRDAELALRVVIHATDDTFLEYPSTFTSGIQVQHTYVETVAKLQDETIRVGTFAAHLGGPSGNENVEPGFFTDYGTESAIPAATSGGVFDIDEVFNQTISLTEAINDFVLEELCTPYVPE